MGRKHNRIGAKAQKIPKEKKKRAPRKTKKVIEKPFANGTMSSSAFFGFIRSALRQKSRWWKPINDCRLKNRIPYTGTNKRRKWTYVCEECKNHFDSKEVAVHHLIPVGTLTCFEDLPLFVKNLFCDGDGLKLVCNGCHEKEHKKLENNKIIDNYGKGNI